MGSSSKHIDIQPYKPARVYDGANEQFVTFSYWSRSKKKYIREKVRYTFPAKLNKEQRLQGLKYLAAELNKIIAHRNKNLIYHDDVTVSRDGGKVNTFVYWLEHFANSADLVDSSQKTVSSLLFNYKKFLKAHPVFESNTPAMIGSPIIEEFVRHMQSEGKVGKTINLYLWGIQFVSGLLVKKRLLDKEINTDPYRVKQVKNATGKYRPLTEIEKTKIFDYFREKDKGFYLYLLNIYYTCIRPGELLRLKIENYDLSGNKILVPWYDAKNGLTRYVQILTPLKNALLEANVKANPKQYFLFGRLFKPSADEYTGKWASDKWREACNKLKIDSSANMYGLKHTFNVDYVENNKSNIDWEWLRRHNRHATIQQTQEYISGLTAYFLDETKAVFSDYSKSSANTK